MRASSLLRGISIVRRTRSPRVLAGTACRSCCFTGAVAVMRAAVGRSMTRSRPHRALRRTAGVKYTEQGEVLSYKYSNRPTATYELSTALAGLLRSSFPPVGERVGVDRRFSAAMEALSEAGMGAYRELVVSEPGFLYFFYEVTPVSELAALNIGSRPSHRPQGGRSLRAIRAIPWVFGWSQARLALPAWYGVGSALAAFAAQSPRHPARLRLMYKSWPYFPAFHRQRANGACQGRSGRGVALCRSCQG